MDYGANFYFCYAKFTFDWKFILCYAYQYLISILLNPPVLFFTHCIYKYYKEMRCQILSDNFFVYKINRHSVELPPPVWFRKFYGAQCFIHTFTRGEFEGRLNIYDCRGISTTVTLPAPLYSDIQTHHPYDCKRPDR